MVSKVFRIELEPLNEFITLEGVEAKIKRIAGGVGLRVISALPVDEIAEQRETDNHHAEFRQSPD